MHQNVYSPKRTVISIPQVGSLTLYTYQDKTFVVLRDIANVLSIQKNEAVYEILFLCGNELKILSPAEDGAPVCLLITDILKLLEAYLSITDQYADRALALCGYFSPKISSELDAFSKLTDLMGISTSDLCNAILAIRQKKFDESQKHLQHYLLTTLYDDIASLAKQVEITPEELSIAILTAKNFHFEEEQKAIYNDFSKH